MLPENLGCTDYFELSVLEKQQILGEAVSEFPHLLKDRSSQRNSTVMNPVPMSFISQGRLTCHRTGD